MEKVTPENIDLANEYASVRIQVDNSANGPRLKITDLSSGAFVFLDPLELESLAWVRHEHLAYIVRPSYREALIDWLSGKISGEMAVEQVEDILRQPA